MFSAALQSGQLGPVVQQFQVGENAVNAANQVKQQKKTKCQVMDVGRVEETVETILVLLSKSARSRSVGLRVSRQDSIPPFDFHLRRVSFFFRQGNMEEFVKALQNTSINQDRSEKEEEAKHVEKKKKTENGENDKKDKKDEDDDKMALD